MAKRAGTAKRVRRRLSLVVVFAGGYYFGTKAGRERYEQIRRRVAEARHSGPVEKAQAAAEAGLERIRGQQTEAVPGTAHGPDARA
jgi:hypothetical protein